MVLHDLSTEVKTHTRSFTGGLCRKEGSENLILDFLVNAGSIISDGDIQLIAIYLQILLTRLH